MAPVRFRTPVIGSPEEWIRNSKSLILGCPPAGANHCPRRFQAPLGPLGGGNFRANLLKEIERAGTVAPAGTSLTSPSWARDQDEVRKGSRTVTDARNSQAAGYSTKA